MTLKQTTQELIRECRGAEMRQGSYQFRIYDKQIAKHIGITPTALSRISTGVTAPDITTFIKLIKYAYKMLGKKRTLEILENVFNTDSDTQSEQENKTG